MSVELSKQQRADAIASVQQYAERNFPEPLGELAAGLLLDFFLEEVGPLLFNQAVHEVQARLQQRVADLEGEMYRAPFTYWSAAADRTRRGRAR